MTLRIYWSIRHERRALSLSHRDHPRDRYLHAVQINACAARNISN